LRSWSAAALGSFGDLARNLLRLGFVSPKSSRDSGHEPLGFVRPTSPRLSADRKPARYRSHLSAAIHETAAGLHRIGLMDKATMREFDGHAEGEAVGALIADERRFLPAYGGRSVFGWERPTGHAVTGAVIRLSRPRSFA
jgi:hypothetical protein